MREFISKRISIDKRDKKSVDNTQLWLQRNCIEADSCGDSRQYYHNNYYNKKLSILISLKPIFGRGFSGGIYYTNTLIVENSEIPDELFKIMREEGYLEKISAGEAEGDVA